MARYAVIKDNKVINVVEYEPGSNWFPPKGCKLLASEIVDMHDIYDQQDNSFLKRDGKKHKADKKLKDYKEGK